MNESKSGLRRCDGFDEIVSALRLLVPTSHPAIDTSADLGSALFLLGVYCGSILISPLNCN
jgi:hypothetical protein